MEFLFAPVHLYIIDLSRPSPLINFSFVAATCKLDLIKNMDMKSMTFIYLEYQQVHIKCLKGFKLFGESNLTCGINGFFNHDFPICEGRNLYCALPKSEMCSLLVFYKSVLAYIFYIIISMV